MNSGQVVAALLPPSAAISNLIDQRLRPDGLTLFQANCLAGWQDVFHLHVHIVPRDANDRLVQRWKDAPHGGAHLGSIGNTVEARKHR